MRTYHSFSYYLGTFLMIAATTLFLYIYLPLVIFFLLPHSIPPIPQNGYYLQIPKINAYAPIILNVDPWNEIEYRQKLTKGVAHAKGTALPGGEETSFIFAHSSDAPWNMSRYNMVFFRLGDLHINDKIFVWQNGSKIEYRISDKKEVWPNEVSFLPEKQKAGLILQTCTPIGTSFKRLLIFAEKLSKI